MPPQGGLSGFISGLLHEFTPFNDHLSKDKRVAAVLPFTLKKTVVLVGMMGAGKTAIGAALARRLDVPFLDSDAEIERAANMAIAEIFARDGEKFFRRKETQVITRLLQSERGILSTGGGAFLKRRNRNVIAKHGVALWLKADLDLLWQRVRHKTTRPLLRTDNPYETLKALYEARVPKYARAGLVVESKPEYSIEDMTTKVIDALLEHPEILETVQ